jgi:aminomethyltransferase
VSAAEPSPLARFFTGRGVKQIEVAGGIFTPERFTDPAVEHMATRRTAGLFDFSFMACVEIGGRDSLGILHRLQTRNLASLQVNRLAYTLLLRDNGTVINDATIWRIADDRFLLFTGRHADLHHLAALACGLNVSVEERSGEHAVLAVQGKNAWAIIKRCLSADGAAGHTPPSYYGFVPVIISGSMGLLARIGYSGETGYELVIPTEAAPDLWQALLQAGNDLDIAECGFSAIDSLRIEAGHILFLRELALPVTPFEIGLARLVNFYNADCAGVKALRHRRWRSPACALAGLILDERAPEPKLLLASDLTAVTKDHARLTSLCLSPLIKRRIGLGLVDLKNHYPGARVQLEAGINATVARLPFYDPARHLARRTN